MQGMSVDFSDPDGPMTAVKRPPVTSSSARTSALPDP